MPHISSSDPWLHAIKMLKRSNGCGLQRSQSVRAKAPLRAPSRQNSSIQKNRVIRVIDKPTSTTATLAWFDSTSCYYGDQRWSLRVARANGTCALTGEPVRKGDRVYQPRKSGHRPMNANEMILSSVLSLATSSDVPEVSATTP